MSLTQREPQSHHQLIERAGSLPGLGPPDSARHAQLLPATRARR